MAAMAAMAGVVFVFWCTGQLAAVSEAVDRDWDSTDMLDLLTTVRHRDTASSSARTDGHDGRTFNNR